MHANLAWAKGPSSSPVPNACWVGVDDDGRVLVVVVVPFVLALSSLHGSDACCRYH